MTFNELNIDIDIMKEFDEAFESYTDSELISLKRDIALKGLRNDLSSSLNISYDNTDTLDKYADKYNYSLSQALMYLQLYYFYFNVTVDKESATYIKMLECRRQYDIFKSGFSAYQIEGNVTARSIKVQRG